MSKVDDSFLLPLSELSKFLSKVKSKGVIIGGISAGLLGKPRFTADIDAVIQLDFERIEEFIKTADKFGFEPRIGNAAAFAQKSHVILLMHKKSGIKVDLSIGLLPFEMEVIKRSKLFTSGRLRINIPSPEDLIIMKAVSHRPKDIEDIRSIVNANPKLDISRIKYWLQEFSKVLEMPEIWNDIAVILKRK